MGVLAEYWIVEVTFEPTPVSNHDRVIGDGATSTKAYKLERRGSSLFLFCLNITESHSIA